MLKSISLLVILAITISFSIQYADAITQKPLPEAPENFRVYSVANGQAELRWAPVDGTCAGNNCENYHITYRAVGSSIVDDPPILVQTKQTIQRITGLDNALDYTFTIRTQDDNGIIELAPALSEKYAKTITLQRTVQNLTLDNIRPDGEYLAATLTWDPPNNPQVTKKGTPYTMKVTNLHFADTHDDKMIVQPTNDRVQNLIPILFPLYPGHLYTFEVTARQDGGGIPTTDNQTESITVRMPELVKVETKENPILNNLKKESTHDTITLSWTGEQATCSLEVTQNGKHVKFVTGPRVNNVYEGVRSPLTIENLKPNTEYTFDFDCGTKVVDSKLTANTTTTTATTQSTDVPYVEPDSEPIKSPVPEIPGAVPPGSDDDIETTVGGDKTVTLKLFAFEDTSSQAFVDEKCVRDIEGVECPTEKNIADGIHDGDRINVVGGSERGDSSIPPIHEYGDGKRQTYGDGNNRVVGFENEGDSPVPLTVIIWQPSTGEMEVMKSVKSATNYVTIDLLPEPFYVIPMKPDNYEFTTPTFTDENDIEHKGVLKVNETYQTGITIDELFVNNSSPELKLEPGAVITVGIGVIPSQLGS